jgi:hypothetical protein
VKLEDFCHEISRLVTPPGHLWVGSGCTTVQPLERTAAGVGAFYSPPVAAHGARLTVSLFLDEEILVTDTGSYGKGDVGMLYQGGRWMPDRIERRGTWHHVVNGVIRSISLQSELVPLASEPGYALCLRITNRGDKPESVRVHYRLEPGMVELRPLSAWVFGLPRAGEQAVEVSPARFRGHGVELLLSSPDRAIPIAPGATATSAAVVTAAPGSARRAEAGAETPRLLEESRTAWTRRVERFTARLPEVSSSIPGLAEYYRGSVASGLVCIWENPVFVNNPFLATSGMDGGAICTYLWDLGGYVPGAATLLLGRDMVAVAESLARVPLEEFFAVTPDGSPTGTGYSYSVFSFTSLVWAIATLVGPVEHLFTEAKRLFDLAEKQFPSRGLLLDYGTQRNMLEMRGTGWEHVVASPNAERAWCLERLADLGEWFGAIPGDEARAAREKAAAIRTAIQQELWDPQARWFRAIFPDGHVEIAHSIQAFDALRAGACTPDMEQALVDEVVDGAFLGAYGASSVSARDQVHYECNDPDWSGAGAYTGDPPALALTLYERGRPEKAWDVLSRLFWMGRHLPYYPQEHRCDVPQTVGHKRANCISGLGGAEAIIFGLAGVRASLDGRLDLRPSPPRDGEIELRGLRIRGTRLDIRLSPGEATVHRDGKKIHDGPAGLIPVLPGIPPDHPRSASVLTSAR